MDDNALIGRQSISSWRYLGDGSQELAQSEAQLAEVTTERHAIAAEADAAAAVSQEPDAAGVPDDVEALTDAWGEAINTGGGAVTALYSTGDTTRYRQILWIGLGGWAASLDSWVLFSTRIPSLYSIPAWT
jgi:hypothetical protein